MGRSDSQQFPSGAQVGRFEPLGEGAVELREFLARRAGDTAATGHKDPYVRRAAYRAIRTRPEGPSEELMTACAKDSWFSVRVLAVVDLHRSGAAGARAQALSAATLGASLVGVRDDAPEEEDLQSLVTVLTSYPDRDCVLGTLALAAAMDETARLIAVGRLARLRAPEPRRHA